MRQLLTQQRYKEFSVQPSAAALIIVFGNMPDLRDGFQTFEGQLHLPAQPICFENFFRAGRGSRKGGEHQHILGIFSRLRAYAFPILLLDLQFALGLLDRFSFAPAPCSFDLLKTIVRPGKLIICKHLEAWNKEQPTHGVCGHPDSLLRSKHYYWCLHWIFQA